MLIRRPDAIPTREITDPALVLRRRDFLRGAALLGAGATLPGLALPQPAGAARRLPGVKPGPFGTDEAQTPIEDASPPADSPQSVVSAAPAQEPTPAD